MSRWLMVGLVLSLGVIGLGCSQALSTATLAQTPTPNPTATTPPTPTLKPTARAIPTSTVAAAPTPTLPPPPPPTPEPVHPVIQYITVRNFDISPEIIDSLKFLAEDGFTATEKGLIDVFGSVSTFYSVADQQRLLAVVRSYVNDGELQLLTKATEANLPALTISRLEFHRKKSGKSEFDESLIPLLAKYSPDEQLTLFTHYDWKIDSALVQPHVAALEAGIPFSTAFELRGFTEDGEVSKAETTFIGLLAAHPQFRSELIDQYPIVDDGLVEALSHGLSLKF